MLLDPSRTPYDWSFRLLGFPVRVQPWFWLGSAILGGDLLRAGIEYLLIWIAAVFISILIHELGHGLAFRCFGVDSDILLIAFGGLTVPYSHVHGRGRRILVSLAGPGAGFLLYALLRLSNNLYPWPEMSRHIEVLYLFLLVINLYWGIFNLLPVWPLDGGQVTRELCSGLWKWNGKRVSLEISVAVAGVIAVYSVACAMKAAGAIIEILPGWFPQGSYWTAILFGLLAVQSYQLLQQEG